jgi:FkbM family methyltransferase
MADTRVPILPDSVVVHGEASVTAHEPLTIQTRPLAWAYALSLQLSNVKDIDVLEVRLRVSGGAVGVGCGSPDLTAILDEVIVEPSAALQTVSLLPPSGNGRLVIRTGAAGSPATVEIHEVRGRPFTSREAAAPRTQTLTPVANWSRFYGTAGASVAEKRRVRDYLGLTEPVTMPWLEGLEVVIRPDDQLSRALFVSGAYEPSTMLVVQRLLPRGGVFFDVGAHVGLFTLIASRWVGPAGRVYSFEPSPRERSRLEQHLAMNGCANVTVIPKAAGDSVGTASLIVAPAGASGLNTIGSQFAYAGVASEQVIPVPMTSLDEIVSHRNIDAVDVVKLDVEGAEYRCLLGAARMLERHRPSLVIEIFSTSLAANGATVRDIDRLLAAASYCLFRIDDAAALHPLDSLEEVDEQNVVAVPAERSADDRSGTGADQREKARGRRSAISNARTD